MHILVLYINFNINSININSIIINVVTLILYCYYSFLFSFCKIAPLWLMSFFDRDAGMAVTPDGLRCQSRDPKTWQGARCTKGVTGKGKYYYEAVVSDEGLCRVGWATPQVGSIAGTFVPPISFSCC